MTHLSEDWHSPGAPLMIPASSAQPGPGALGMTTSNPIDDDDAILTDAESRSFSTFLDSFQHEQLPLSFEADIIGGADIVFRPTTTTSSSNSSGLSSSAPSGDSYMYNHHDGRPYLVAPHSRNQYPIPHVGKTDFPASASYPSQLAYFAPTQPHQPNGQHHQYPTSYLTNLPLHLRRPSPETGMSLESKSERMAKQTRDLEDWLNSRGVIAPNGVVQPHPSGDQIHHSSRRPRGEEPLLLSPASRTRSLDPAPHLQHLHHNPHFGHLGDATEGASAAGPSLGGTASSSGRGRRTYSEERPPKLDQHNEDDTMAKMREAELRAGFSKRVDLDEVAFHQRKAHSPVSARSSNGAQSSPYIPPPPPPLPSTTASSSSLSASTSKRTANNAPNKRKAVSSSSLLTGPNGSNSNSTEGSSTANPPPRSTPSNIPPSTFVPPTIQASQIPPAPNPFPNSSSAAPSNSSSSTKPALLTPAQKKANHIASEQKRRAAIRQGYEGLCVVVPSLRAAVEEFEERVRCAELARKGKKGANAKNGKGDREKGTQGGVLMGGIEVGGEKIDGRAGPKSEAVVLSKTVEHVRALLASREQLLGRLSMAYAVAAERGVKVEGGRRVWDEHWDERMTKAHIEKETGVAVKQEDEMEEDWEEE
ncbi:hypothetical protein T439DRAFT_349694 [Meredithblackwellia eburnea MCA 4105]